MRFRPVALAVGPLALIFCAVAMAAALPRAHTRYFYVKKGAFSISLTTSRSATRIVAGKPAGASAILVVCPKTSAGGINEVQMGFPGAKLTRGKGAKGNYGFAVTYTEKSADLVTISPVFGHVTHLRAKANITGVLNSSKLIVGTVSVTAKGCGLPGSRYRATRS